MTLPYTYDDGGRLAAGFKGDTGDCVPRAIAIATGLPYREVYDALAERMEGRKVGRRGAKRPSKRTAREGVLRKVYEPYLFEHGWFWTPTMHIGSGCTVHLTDGELPMDSHLIVAFEQAHERGDRRRHP